MSKPWDNEPTPIIDNSDMYYPDTAIEVGRNLERRMRAAELLLEDERREAVGMQFDLWCREADAHLEAAKREDGQ